ncbi:MAG TPA: PEGA domain-containing protein [Terriglobales bacterium]|nr:PEGA domain-containing protein [Terriglobales bacterium]
MFTRKVSLLVLALIFALPAMTYAQSARIKFDTDDGGLKNAGVWVDGQYVGYIDDLNHDHKLVLLPGKHEVLVKQAWYHDFLAAITLEPGETHTLKVSMEKIPVQTPQDPAKVRLEIYPVRAAVFVDDQFTGLVQEFNLGGKWLLLQPGQHKLRIAMPGYQPFETTVSLLPNQKMKLQTNLMTGSITEAGALLNPGQKPPSE